MMPSHQLLVLFHLIAAAIWVGGHLILSLGFLPGALKQQDVRVILDFEKRYERIGIPALLILVTTGIMLAYRYDVPLQSWFHFTGSIEKVVSVKLLLLFITAGLGINARFFLIPKLDKKNLRLMAAHIIGVTVSGLAMLLMGSTIRWGGI